MVDFDLSAEQLELREAADSLVGRYTSRDRLRARVGTGAPVGGGTEDQQNVPSGFDVELWGEMVRQGWLAVERPEAAGGLGMGLVEAAVLSEVLGRRLAPVPFVPTLLALHCLDSATPPGAAAAELADQLSEGGVGCVSVQCGNRPGPVLYAPSAQVAVVADEGTLKAFAMGPENRPLPENAMDRTRELGWLSDPPETAVTIGGETETRSLLDRAAVLFSAEMLGVAERALEMAVDYAKERVQFGKPIGSFQAVKHMLADAFVDVEGMRSACFYAAWCVEAGDPDASLAASMAKAWSSDAARRVTETALQVHGGIGFTWEHDMHLYLKRAQLDWVSFGDATFHRDRIISMLRERLAQGAPLL